GLVGKLWAKIKQTGIITDALREFNGEQKKGESKSSSLPSPIPSVLSLFCVCFSHQLVILDDVDFFRGVPFPLPEVIDMVEML
ncbi:hypothetical protein, partial [Klebsiella pneumoniae]|uniref:hypothetical protein n=1 Tax=Klebsiella pneumoniae TaxID=573 RepID=UPI003B97EF64